MGFYEKPRAHAYIVGGCPTAVGKPASIIITQGICWVNHLHLSSSDLLRQGLEQKITRVTYVLSITILGLQSNLVKQIKKHDQITCACVCTCMCLCVCSWLEREGGSCAKSRSTNATTKITSSPVAIRTQRDSRGS